MTDVNYRFLKIYFVRRVTGISVWQSSFPHYYGTNTENSELLVHSYEYLDTATYFYNSLVIILHQPIKRRLISLSPSSESLAPSSDSVVNPSIYCYLALHSRHFVRHLSICNPICVKLLQLMCAVITHNSAKKWSHIRMLASVFNWPLSPSPLHCFILVVICWFKRKLHKWFIVVDHHGNMMVKGKKARLTYINPWLNI